MARKSQSRAPPHAFGLPRMRVLLSCACTELRSAGGAGHRKTKRETGTPSASGAGCGQRSRSEGKHTLLLASFSAGNFSQPPDVSSEDGCDDYLRDRRKSFGQRTNQL